MTNIPRACIGGTGPCADGGRAVAGASRCRNHIGKGGWARYKVAHPERALFYSSPYWRQRRQVWLAENPDCAVCGQPAKHVDHVRAVADGGPLDGPVQSLCVKHHREKTLAESHRGMKRAAARRPNRG